MTDVTAADVEDLFRLILDRRPESPAVVAHHQSLGLDRTGLGRLLMQTPESRERERRRGALDAMAADLGSRGWPRENGAPKRVVLWGAFGNGNIGNSAQACAVADLLRPLLPAGTVFGASSWERRSTFPAPDGMVLPTGAVLGPLGLDADLLVIGGGGLFGTPHFPLSEPGWAEAVVTRGLPVVLLGVGGAAAALDAHAPAYDPLLRHAAWVGVRDAETLAAVRRVRPDAAWFPDPVLARAVLTAAIMNLTERPVDALLIPRVPNGPEDAAALDGMLAWRAAAMARGSRIETTVLEPALDCAALARRGLADPSQPGDWAALLAQCRRAKTVVSLRLHGAIAGIEAGCVVHGLTQPKTRLLFEELGLSDWFSSSWRDPDTGELSNRSFAAARDAGMLVWRNRLRASITELGAGLATIPWRMEA